MGCKVKCMPLPKNIDVFNNVSANSSLSSTKACSCLTETGEEIQECARRTIGRAYWLTAHLLFLTL